MSVSEFLASPWKTSHPAYDGAPIAIRPAPEFATAEVLLASTYRAVGFREISERLVSQLGRDFDKASLKAARGRKGTLSPEAWRAVLHGALQSPRQKKQSARRFLSLSPVVPDTALYAGSARLAGNPWNPGQLVARMVALGAQNRQDALGVWTALFDALSVSDDDDVWARWLQAEFEGRRLRGRSVDWKATDLESVLGYRIESLGIEAPPATQFVADLRIVLRTKSAMTRRQWMSILESVLRLGAVAHVLWLCEVHERLWRELRLAVKGRHSGAPAEVTRSLFCGLGRPLVHGQPALPIVRDLTSRYLTARLYINLVLWTLEDAGAPVSSIQNISDIHALLELTSSLSNRIDAASLEQQFATLCDANARELACKRGVGNNLVEFCRYVLGQRQSADDTLRGYDQGYQVRKRAEYASAPWDVSLGPVALLAFTHCCLNEANGPRSVLRLCEHLSRYGLDVDRDDIAAGDLGQKLRMLGLVLDSPDAENGMLLVPPFEMRVARAETA